MYEVQEGVDMIDMDEISKAAVDANRMAAHILCGADSFIVNGSSNGVHVMEVWA